MIIESAIRTAMSVLEVRKLNDTVSVSIFFTFAAKLKESLKVLSVKPAIE